MWVEGAWLFHYAFMNRVSMRLHFPAEHPILHALQCDRTPCRRLPHQNTIYHVPHRHQEIPHRVNAVPHLTTLRHTASIAEETHPPTYHSSPTAGRPDSQGRGLQQTFYCLQPLNPSTPQARPRFSTHGGCDTHQSPIRNRSKSRTRDKPAAPPKAPHPILQ